MVDGNDAVAVISERLWRSHFGGDPKHPRPVARRSTASR